MVKPYNEELSAETVRVTLKWKSQGKRLRRTPRKRWMDMVEYLKTLRVEDW